MLELIVIDLCAALLAEELKLSLTVSQAEKDGLRCYVYAPLPRKAVRRALRVKGILELFDSLLHEEILGQMTSEEFRLLADPERTLWMRHPDDIDYRKVLPFLGERKRLLPRALHLLGQPIDPESRFHTDTESSASPSSEE